jgi:hypothetical protein
MSTKEKKQEETKKNQFISLVDSIITRFPPKSLSSLVYEYYVTVEFDTTIVYFRKPVNMSFDQLQNYVSEAPYIKVSDSVIEIIKFSNPWIVVPLVISTPNYKIMFKYNRAADINLYFLKLDKTTTIRKTPFMALDEMTCDMKQSRVHTHRSCSLHACRFMVVVQNDALYIVYINDTNAILKIHSYKILTGLTFAIGLGYEHQVVSIEQLFDTNDPFWKSLDFQIGRTFLNTLKSLAKMGRYEI